jgi:protein-disulfide isomerase
MEECEFCEEEFEGEEDLHIHWMEEHEEELNSHQKDKAKKAKRDRNEREKIRKEQRKKYLYQGIGAAVFLGLAALIVPQLIPSGGSTEITLENEPMIGDQNASVKVVEYGDFQCPACRNFEQTVYSQIKSEYIDTGQVKFYWKDFPLESVHPWASSASEVAECTYRQNETAFWNVKDSIFTNQPSLNTGNAQKEAIGYAVEAGVNESELRSCIQNDNPGSAVTEDIREGRSNGVSGTPTIFVNGERLGSFNYATVSQAIEDELGN